MEQDQAQSAKPEPKGIAHVFDAARYSFQGLKAAYLNEEAFRLELIALVFMVPAGLILGRSGLERAVLLGTLIVVLIVELVNSAIEAVVDRIGTERHVLSGRAKDIGSAAVFMSLVLAGVVWGLILHERFFG